jgi:hypothetical protein
MSRTTTSLVVPGRPCRVRLHRCEALGRCPEVEDESMGLAARGFAAHGNVGTPGATAACRPLTLRTTGGSSYISGVADGVSRSPPRRSRRRQGTGRRRARRRPR